MDREDTLAVQVRQLEAEARRLETQLLDQFAIAALRSNHNWGDMGYGFTDAASDCYDMAEAMMKERNKRIRQNAKTF